MLANLLAAISASTTGGLAQDAVAQSPADVSDAPRDRSFIAPEHHPWARFSNGSWKRVRIVEQTLDREGNVTIESVTDRTESLEDVGPHHFSLKQKVSVTVEGRLVEAPPKTVTLCLATEEPGQVESVVRGAPEAVVLEGRSVDAQVFDVATSGELHSVTARIWYAPDEPPHILRSITEAVSQATQEPIWIRHRKVLARDLPFVLLKDHHVTATFFDEQHTTSKASRHSIVVWVDEVPGGIAARWTTETNAEGRVVRREMETLLGWEGERRAKEDLPPRGKTDQEESDP